MLTEDINRSTAPTEPKTRALEATIQASVNRVLSGQDKESRDGLLFLSSWQEAMPAMVHLDPVLQAIDTRVFAVLWIWGKQNGPSSLAFPSYDYLMRHCQIQSRATLSRCLAILRVTRWITLCRRIRDDGGRYRGNVYALHDEPLSLAGTIHLDSQYLPFLFDAADHHHHNRVRRVAQAMLSSLRAEIDNGRSVLEDSTLSTADRRVEAINTINRLADGDHFFSFHANVLRRLKDKHQQIHKLQAEQKNTQVQKSNLDQVRLSNCKKSNLGICSSSKNNIYKKTTTTTSEVNNNHSELSTGGVSSSLIYSESLTPNERKLAQMHVQKLPLGLQQPMLDELHGQIRSRQHTHKPIGNPIGFLCWLCNEARIGRIHLTSHSTQVRERRERERKLTAYDEARTRELTEQARKQLESGVKR